MVIGMKLQLFQKEPKKSNEFAPDETLAALVPLGERIYINSILCLLYFFLKIWVIVRPLGRGVLRLFHIVREVIPPEYN